MRLNLRRADMSGLRQRPCAVHCMQALVSRETSPLGTAVVSVTKQAAGEGAYNVIPASASFGGTIRSLSHDHLMHLKRRINEVRSASGATQGEVLLGDCSVLCCYHTRQTTWSRQALALGLSRSVMLCLLSCRWLTM